MLRALGCWLYNWQTLVGALVAGAAAIIAAIIAWKAVMKQITVTQSERDRREKYAAALAVKRQARRFVRWKKSRDKQKY
jgi:hypothetical protein